MPAPGPSAAIGIPPLSLSQGPSFSTAQSDGALDSNTAGHATTGDFVFKGKGRANDPVSSISPVLTVAIMGVALWIAMRR